MIIQIEEAINNLKEIKNEDKLNSNIVETGDNIVFVTMMFVIALAGIVIMLKMKKEENN
ncbi:MAG: hypothetical protein PHP54_03955 [Clostridia bacterium]|nr:hypothetical protein [Clostridia bacterium]